MGQSWNFREARCGNWSIEGEEGRGGIIVGNWVSRTTVSRKSHFQPSLAVKGSRADYRVAGGEISAVRARNDEFSSPLRVFQGCGWVRTVSFQWYVLDYRRSGKWFISVPETAENRGPREEGKICNLVPRVVENKSPNYRSNCDRIEARTKIDSRHDESMLFQGLDNVSSATLRPFNSDINTPRIDSYRFSMANLEGELSFFFFFYKPCTGHVMDTTSIVQFPYPSLCLLPKEKKRRRRRKVKVLSPHFVHPRCSRFYIRFVSPVCRTVFLHPPPFCASWINEQRGQKGRFIPPRDCGVFFLGTRKRGKRGSYPLSLSLIKSNSECLALLLDTLSRCEIEMTVNEFFYDLGVEGARHKEQFPLFYRTSWDNLKDKRGWKIRSGFVAWSWITIYW